jgi:hypothetical protein
MKYHVIWLALLALFVGSARGRAEVLSPLIVKFPVPAHLATPARGSLYTVPVVVIAFMPTDDGVNVNSDETGVTMSLSDLSDHINEMNTQIKFALEEGSRFHGYKDPAAKPSLGYKVVGCIAAYVPLPRDTVPVPWDKSHVRPDYKRILEILGAKQWVEEQGAKEIWLWGYHHGDIEPAESNMSSPVSGNISNSEGRMDNLPTYSKTYVLYNYNYSRSACEAIHDHGHQLEAQMSYLAAKQEGNSDLWDKFMGREAGQWVTGHCGWTHMPPNTTKDYDYKNPVPVQSDIEDWKPDGSGKKELISSRAWSSLVYPWPGADVPTQRTEANWYIYWRQNIPGLNNNTPLKDGHLTNWWRFVGDWDGAIKDQMGLYTPDPKSKP